MEDNLRLLAWRRCARLLLACAAHSPSLIRYSMAVRLRAVCLLDYPVGSVPSSLVVRPRLVRFG